MNISSTVKSTLQGMSALCLIAVLLSWGLTAQAKPSDIGNLPNIDAFQHVMPGAGWLLFNNSLYWTSNNGGTWSEITPSAGIQAVDFLDFSRGWALSTSDKSLILLRTTDGGISWKNRPLHLPQIHLLEAPIAKVFMDWRTPLHGWLVVKAATGSNFNRGMLFITTDGGRSWVNREVPLGEPVLFTDEMNGRMSGGPAGDQSFITQDGGVTWAAVPVELDPGIQDGFVERSMSGHVNGWAKWQSGECSSGICIQEVKLMSTSDGITWNPMRLPNGQTTLTTSSPDHPKSTSADTDTTAYQGQGFDTCELPGTYQLQTWWNSSPYSAVNLYIGGISRGCSNTALTAALLSELNAQGWRFFPTWVGPQAACTNYIHRMSIDPTLAYNQGVAEAISAAAAAQGLGLTEADGSGTVIYYDLEAYPVEDPDCRAAANAFIDGWTHQLKILGNQAGVYGAAYGSAVSDWWSIPNVPDAVWIAHWVEDSFSPGATVSSPLINEAYWDNHQRLRQYAGGHNETWGGQTINIDSNVVDGPLTVPNGTAGSSLPTAPFNPYPANGGSVGRASDTWLRWKTTGDTCTIHVWGNTLDMTASTPCSLYHLGMQDPGMYSWQVTATNPSGSTIGPAWTLKVRPAPPTALSALAHSATSVDLTWTASIDIVDNYLVYANGKQVANLPGTATSTQVQNMACNTSHEFFVKSAKDSALSVGSVHAFAVTPSCAPVLIYPLDVLVNTLQPTFTWAIVTEATQYQIQASPYSDFSSLVLNALPSSASYTPPLPFQAKKEYYWRVRALGSFGQGDWAASSFKTPNPPPPPMLFSPVNNILVTDYTPRFDWRDVIPPAGTRLHHYQIQVAKDPGFSIIVFDKKTLISEFTPLTMLAPNSSFYWRVRSVNGLGQSGVWSVVANFRTAIRPPVLFSPTNGSTLAALRPGFDWKDVAGATSYSIQISTSSGFTSLLMGALVLTSSFTPPVDLPGNMTLYWHVRANGLNGPSRWSTRWSFTAGVTTDLLFPDPWIP